MCVSYLTWEGKARERRMRAGREGGKMERKRGRDWVIERLSDYV